MNRWFFLSFGAVVVGVVILAGRLADHVGRHPLLVMAGLGACGGTIVLMMAQDFLFLFLGGGFIALSGGLYASASWALATDLAPKQNQALYLGLANGATVIGSLSGRLGGPLIDGLNYIANNDQIGYLSAFFLAALFFAGSSITVLKIPRHKGRIVPKIILVS